MLDDIARALNVELEYLRGDYLWTLEVPVMESEEVRDYWLEHFLDPSRFPYISTGQRRIDPRAHLLDILAIHGIEKEDFLRLPRDERDGLVDTLDHYTTEILRQRFPNCTAARTGRDYEMTAWHDERDVIETMLDYLIEKKLVMRETTERS